MVNRFDCVNVWHEISMRAKLGIIQQNYNVIEKINLKDRAKRSKYKTMQKKQHHVKDSGVNSATCKYSST